MNISSINLDNKSYTINYKGKLKPIFKSNVEGITPNVPEHLGEGHNLLGWLGGIVAIGTAFFALFKGHKSKVEIKEKNKILSQEHSIVTDRIEKLKQEMDKLKSLNEKKDKEITEIAAKLKVIKESDVNTSINNNSTTNTTSSYSAHTRSQAAKCKTEQKVKPEHSTSDTLESKKSNTENTVLNIDENLTSLSAEEFQQKMETFQLNYKKEMDKLQEQMADLKGIKDTADIAKLLEQLDNIRGFERIQGYSAIKDFFKEKLINESKEYPNTILLYGPQGTGKTLFAKEVSYEANAEHVALKLSINAKKNLESFKEIILNSKETFEKTGKRTIIQIDELEAFLKDDNYNEEIVDIINKLDKVYHATLIATTNEPKYLSNKFLNSENLEKLYLPPANKIEISQILKFVSQYIMDNNANYDSIADFIIRKAGKDAYSNARIYSVIKKIVNNHKDVSNKMQEKDLIEAINREIGDPDITRKSLDRYQEYMSRGTVLPKTNTNPFEKYNNFADLSASEFERTMKDFQEDFKQQMSDLQSELQKIETTKNRTDVSQILALLEKVKGFARIQGANNIKDFFYKNILLPEKLKKIELVPNTVLLYGPQGTGKTLFAKELANEGDFNYIYFNLPRNEEKLLSNMQNLINKCKENYTSNGKRTIIQIDEIDTIILENPTISQQISKILDKLSSEYHSTILATTNNPSLVDKVFTSTKNFKSLYMPPANKDDIAAILKYVGQYITDSSVNFEVIAQKILDKAGSDAYSNARIYKFIKEIAVEHNNISKKLNQQDFELAVEEMLTAPDIDHSTLNLYKSITF